MTKFVVASGYLFTPIDDLTRLKKQLLQLMKQHHILGTFIIAPEGINTSFSGQAEPIQSFIEQLKQEVGFKDISFQTMKSMEVPFERAKVKIRAEIVTMGIPKVTSLEDKKTHLSPQDWNKLLDDPNVIIVDTRNDYEVNIGHFKHAQNPKTETFRDFPQYVQTQLLPHKSKTIAMYCTGGIRCEKSTAYLKQLGFDSVFQLDGGILNYLKQIPASESKWDGQCFVFDDRIAV